MPKMEGIPKDYVTLRTSNYTLQYYKTYVLYNIQCIFIAVSLLSEHNQQRCKDCFGGE